MSYVRPMRSGLVGTSPYIGPTTTYGYGGDYIGSYVPPIMGGGRPLAPNRVTSAYGGLGYSYGDYGGPARVIDRYVEPSYLGRGSYIGGSRGRILEPSYIEPLYTRGRVLEPSYIPARTVVEPSYIPTSRRMAPSYIEPYIEPFGYGGFMEDRHRSHPLNLYPVPIPYEDELVPVRSAAVARPAPVVTARPAPVVTAAPVARPAPVVTATRPAITTAAPAMTAVPSYVPPVAATTAMPVSTAMPSYGAMTTAAPMSTAMPMPMTTAAPMSTAMPMPMTTAAPMSTGMPMTTAAPMSTAMPMPMTTAAPMATGMPMTTMTGGYGGYGGGYPTGYGF